MSKKIKQIKEKYLEKGKYTKAKLIIAIIISLLVSTILVVMMPTKIWDRLPIFSIAILFTLMHFIFKLKDMYEFIYKFRYVIALLILVYIVIMGYSGSSIGCYNQNIQSESDELYYSPILFDARPIRSDEWNVNTPIALSQSVDQDNSYAYYNDNLRGVATEMFSIAASPVSDILILAKPFFIGFLLFGAEHGLAFLWYGKMIALMLMAFELCMLITNKKKLVSLFGMILIVFSAATQWWNLTEPVIWGGLALVLIDKFMLTKKYKVKILCALGIFISAISYIFILYPAWQLTYGYVFLAIFIWIIIKNRKLYKFNLKDAIIILLVILAVAGIGFRYYSMSKDVLNTVMNTDYPGERFDLGGGAKGTMFSYVYSMFFPYEENMSNPCELSGMLSIYPIPMLVAVLFLIRSKDRKKYFSFLIPMLLITSLLSLWCFVSTNQLLAKITFLYMCPGTRAAVPLGFAQILLMVYLIANVKKEDKLLGKGLSKIVAVILSAIILSIAIKTDSQNVLGNLKSYICGIILLAEVYLLFTINEDKSKKYFIALLIPIALITGATINPVQKGISVLTDKPIAKKVQEIIKEDPENNLWISSPDILPNYFLANGAKVINSVNTYPNFELFKKILGDNYEKEEYRKIYNRYAHLIMQIIPNEDKSENTIKLLQPDVVEIRMNVDTIKDIGAKYMVVRTPLEELSNENITFEQIYNEQGMLIYKINY